MKKLLDSVNSPEDLKKLPADEIPQLAEEIREFLIESVSKTGGHLASNLGAVELTIALHRVFDLKHDRIVFDVGHQSYVHKILTGRKDKFPSLRKEGGLSGFPKTAESRYDAFNTGHSSTSVSAALGIARARDLAKDDYKVIALIGDGALTGGLAYEALCDAGKGESNIIVILNDNEMSISENVGGMSAYLSTIRTRPSYMRAKSFTEQLLNKTNSGRRIANFMRRVKNHIKHMVLSDNLFEALGFKYIGPIDGHNEAKLEKYLERSKEMKGPVLVHVCTIKGMGYEPAMKNPSKFHGISPFDKETGECPKKSTETFSSELGKYLCEIADKNEKVVAISPAMVLGSGLEEFSQRFKGHLFDVGIAEGHAVCNAAGLAMGGFVPVVCIYSSFLQRAYDQIIHDVAMQNLHVVFCIDRAGVVGADGETHQGNFDIAMLSHIPNMTVLSPHSFNDLGDMLRFAVNECKGPVAIRYPRGSASFEGKIAPFEFGKCTLLRNGADAAVFASGNMLSKAVSAADMLESEGINISVVSVRTIIPIDEETVKTVLSDTKNAVVLEDGQVFGGLGSEIARIIAENAIDTTLEIRGYDEFVAQATQESSHKKYGLDAESVYEYIKNTAGKQYGKENTA